MQRMAWFFAKTMSARDCSRASSSREQPAGIDPEQSINGDETGRTLTRSAANPSRQIL